MLECSVCLLADNEVGDFYDSGSPRHIGCDPNDNRLVLESSLRELRNLYTYADPIPANRLKFLVGRLELVVDEPAPVERLIRHFDSIALDKRRALSAGKGVAA
jgi:hypothetical protein